MKERPILFSGAMVRSLLNCTKSQTRRVVKGFALELLAPDGFTPEYVAMPENRNCPYGYAGDRLWVRESWRAPTSCDHMPPRSIADSEAVRFMADEVVGADAGFGKGRPGMFMPRWACRINLEITGVRVERLQDISEADAIAEGIQRVGDGWQRFHVDPDAEIGQAFTRNPVLAYRGLWESINGAGSWDANPWVWCIEFKRVTE